MATLAELVKQREALEEQILALQSEDRSKAIAKVHELMAEHGLSVADISGRAKSTKSVSTGSRRKVEAKYRDTNGNSWSGRGLKPKWLTAALATGKKIDDFAV